MNLGDTIKVPVDTEEKSKMREIPANVKEGLAIHERVDMSRLDWVVTHVATGRYIFSVLTQERAELERERLLALSIDWTKAAEDLVASEDWQAAATIVRDLWPTASGPKLVTGTARMPGF